MQKTDLCDLFVCLLEGHMNVSNLLCSVLCVFRNLENV